MDNNLSELSKPVFEIEVSGGHWLNCTSGKLTPDAGADFSDWPDGVNRLYSQEYVSALIQRAERLDSMLTESVQALKAVELRNAELELRLAVEIEPPPVIYPGRYDCHAMHSAIRRAGFRVSGDSEHVGDVDMRDERALAAVSDKQRIAELEARLATPVQLPKPCAFNLCDLVDRDAVIASLREQGFTVEGDE